MTWYELAAPPTTAKENYPLQVIDLAKKKYRDTDSKAGFCVFLTYTPAPTYYFSPVASQHCYDLLRALGTECIPPTSSLPFLEVTIGDCNECQALLKGNSASTEPAR
jgi:hypothetical protein